MKCPLFQGPKLDESGMMTYVMRDCLEEGCAWWDEEKNVCSVKVIAKELTRIQLRMPHAG